MKLSSKTTIKVSNAEAIVIGHMTYAARKLWNVCNYERHHYKDLGMETLPNWYTQKRDYKGHLWFKNLPAQTAQEVCKVLDKSWKSFYSLSKRGSLQNPHPPRYKQENISITYMQKGIRHDGDVVRLSVPKALKAYLRDKHGIDVPFIYLRNRCFQNIGTIKQIKLYPPEGTEVSVIVVYEVPDVEMKPDNGRYFSIDLGLHNLMTCYNSVDGSTFIVGRKYLSITRKHDKEIGRVQSQWSTVQSRHGVKYPKSSKHIKALFEKKYNCVEDYLHKVTHWVACYCVEQDIHTVILGDMTGIREDNDHGRVENQKLHGLPYHRIRKKLEYKLAMRGITLIAQNEAYSSQCSPLAPSVDKANASKEKRVHRGLYCDAGMTWNADAVGAYNILRLYTERKGIPQEEAILPKNPYVVKVAV